MSVRTALKTLSADDRSLLLSSVVHMADLGSAAKPWRLCRQWTERIMHEFFLEGDAERAMGLELGVLNDREKVVLPKAQVGCGEEGCMSESDKKQGSGDIHVLMVS